MSDSDLNKTVQSLISGEGLPEAYVRTVEQTIVPLADHILSLRENAGETVVVGIHGAQGTGKSTLALFLRQILTRHRRCPTASFSLDDIYLTRAERQALADRVHPLFATRGVPGTHDLDLGREVIARLAAAGETDQTPVPAFDKSIDDRVPARAWPVFRGRADVVLLEGWCVGARPQPEAALAHPINRLEAQEDPAGIWRGYVNDCLKGAYRRFFDQLDSLIMLKAPSMACVLEWRTLQEHKLAQKRAAAPNRSGPDSAARNLRIMTDAEVARFVMHYERVTRFCLDDMPGRADVLIEVAADHRLGRPKFRRSEGEIQ